MVLGWAATGHRGAPNHLHALVVVEPAGLDLRQEGGAGGLLDLAGLGGVRWALNGRV